MNRDDVLLLVNYNEWATDRLLQSRPPCDRGRAVERRLCAVAADSGQAGAHHGRRTHLAVTMRRQFAR